MRGQLSLFEPDFIRDSDCTKDTPVIYGRQDEQILGFTLDNKCDLDVFVGDTPSCVYHGDETAIRSLVTGEFTLDDVYVKDAWMYPAGAFHGAERGPC